MIDIANNIAEFRKKCGFTQKELAERAGVSSQTVSKWEKGISAPDINLLPTLAKIFNISVDMLLGCSTEFENVNLDDAYREVAELIMSRIRFSFPKWAKPEGLEERKKCIEEVKKSLYENPSWETGLGAFNHKIMYYSKDTGFLGLDDVGRKLYSEENDELFDFLSRKINRDIIDIIFEYGTGKYISIEYLVDKSGAKEEGVQKCMDFLCKKHVMSGTSFPVGGGRIVEAYKVTQPEGTRAFIMLRAIVAFAKKFMKKPEKFMGYRD